MRGFIQENRSLYGLTAADVSNLHFLGESVSRESGLRMVRVEQVVNGTPVFQSETRFILDREGHVIRSVGLLVPGATAAAPGASTQFPEIGLTVVNMLSVQDTGASPNGWIPDGGTTTTGNNVDAYLDRVQGTGETNVPDIGALDTEVVLHELTHGLTDRLIGNTAGLEWGVGRGLAEGWSDFYALSLLNNANADDPNGSYAFGAYSAYQLAGLTDNYVYGMRRFPYSTDNTVNPLTWADADDTTADNSGGIPSSPLGFQSNGAFEIHNAGEVWALSLWEVRSRVIAANGGDVPAGNRKMLQVVTDALKMTPNNPSYVEARDALLAADCATNACANEQSIMVKAFINSAEYRHRLGQYEVKNGRPPGRGRPRGP